MKLYLSSYRVPTPRDLSELAGKDFATMKIALITNAKDYYIAKARQFKTSEAIQFFRSIGAQSITEMDLRTLSSPDVVENELKDYDLIWANGGNTFMLRYEMQRSGFDVAIHKLLERGIVYGGESAGAIVAGLSLKGTESMDVPEFADKLVWDGMNLVDKIILPHSDNPTYSEPVTKLANELEKNSTVILKDSQAYVVNGSQVSVVEKEKL